MSFTNQTIVTTGASDGIGAELARQLAREKPKLVLAARRREALQAVASQCEALGATTLIVPTDVSVEADCRALIAAAVAKFGRIDALVNNAGVSMHANFDEISDTAVYESLMRINLMGSVWPTHAALPHLKASKGLIVAVASLAGLVGVPGRTAYSATKFAMTGFFEALRAEQWLQLHPEADAALAAQIKARMRNAFYTDTDTWKGQVIAQARQALFQAVQGLGS